MIPADNVVMLSSEDIEFMALHIPIRIELSSNLSQESEP
jgi:hypothetical protein